jgi:phage shock protein A
MSDEPEDIVLVFLRRLDAKMDRLGEDLTDVKHRLTALEIQVAQLTSTEASHYASTASRLDRLEARIERIERRLDLIATPA